MSTTGSMLGPAGRSRAIETLLLGYAAGSLDPHLHALVESHLILSKANRDFVRTLETAAGDEIERIAPRPLDRAARDHVLSAIYAGGWYGRPRPRKIDPDLPESLDRLVGMRLADVPWRWRIPGVREHIIFEGGGVSAFLLKIKPGGRAPSHTHEGIEATLVLKGAFSDEHGRYARGDIIVYDPSVEHRPVADRGEPCVCFIVTDAPLKLTGPVGRIFQRMFRM